MDGPFFNAWLSYLAGLKIKFKNTSDQPRELYNLLKAISTVSSFLR